MHVHTDTHRHTHAAHKNTHEITCPARRIAHMALSQWPVQKNIILSEKTLINNKIERLYRGGCAVVGARICAYYVCIHYIQYALFYFFSFFIWSQTTNKPLEHSSSLFTYTLRGVYTSYRTYTRRFTVKSHYCYCSLLRYRTVIDFNTAVVIPAFD